MKFSTYGKRQAGKKGNGDSSVSSGYTMQNSKKIVNVKRSNRLVEYRRNGNIHLVGG